MATEVVGVFRAVRAGQGGGLCSCCYCVFLFRYRIELKEFSHAFKCFTVKDVRNRHFFVHLTCYQEFVC